jgi:hypothetical protein
VLETGKQAAGAMTSLLKVVMGENRVRG